MILVSEFAAAAKAAMRSIWPVYLKWLAVRLVIQTALRNSRPPIFAVPRDRSWAFHFDSTVPRLVIDKVSFQIVKRPVSRRKIVPKHPVPVDDVGPRGDLLGRFMDDDDFGA